MHEANKCHASRNAASRTHTHTQSTHCTHSLLPDTDVARIRGAARRNARFSILHASIFPLDASDSWHFGQVGPSVCDAPQAEDWAHATARGVVNGLRDVGFRLQARGINERKRIEIVETIAAIMREGVCAVLSGEKLS